MRLRPCHAVPLVLLLGCPRTTVVGVGPDLGDGDAGARDMGVFDAGARDLATPLVCGDATCAPEAELCCPVPNCETGGEDLICPFGDANCPDVEECPPRESCAPVRARGEGVCARGLGSAWNGSTCVLLSGCDCAGPDCDLLYGDAARCFADHATCERECGSEPACGPRSYCDYPRNGCGSSGDDGRCMPRPRNCDDILDPVCGCDGATYANACAARQAGQDVLSEGEC